MLLSRNKVKLGAAKQYDVHTGTAISNKGKKKNDIVQDNHNPLRFSQEKKVKLGQRNKMAYT
jgi:hypothetical protein